MIKSEMKLVEHVTKFPCLMKFFEDTVLISQKDDNVFMVTVVNSPQAERIGIQWLNHDKLKDYETLTQGTIVTLTNE